LEDADYFVFARSATTKQSSKVLIFFKLDCRAARNDRSTMAWPKVRRPLWRA
jgi:hypothetical protein